MANKTFVVQYLIKARDQFSSQANKVAHALKKVEKNTNKANKANSRLNKAFIGGMKRMAAAAVAFGGVALSAFGFSKLLTVGQRFQDSMLELSAITGATGDQFDAYSKQVMRMAKATKTSQDQVALAFTQVASGKSELLKTKGALAEVTEQAILLSNAAGISIPEAVRASVGALNQFGAGADQANRFVNVIAAGSKVGSSMVFETAEALKNVGKVSESFGTSFELTNSLLQVLAKSELKGAEAGTKLRGVFIRLIQAEKLIGVNLSPNIHGMVGSLEKLNSLGLNSAGMIKLFGAENLTAGQILMENTKLIARWERELTGTNVAQEQAALRLSSFTAKIRGLSVAIDEKLIAAFLRLEPTFTKYAEKFGNFLDTMDDNDIDRFVDNIKGIAVAVDGLVSGLAKAIKLYDILMFTKYRKEVEEKEKGRPRLWNKETGESLYKGGFKVIKTNETAIRKTADLAGLEFDGEVRKPPELKSTADNLKSFLNIGVNVGLVKGLTQTGAAKVKSSGMMRAPNVGMTTEQPA